MIQEHQFRQLQNEFLGRVNHVELTHKRYLYHQINWDARLIGIRGARGTGKTTMLLQYIKEHYPDLNKVLYVSLDSFHFQLMSLFEVAEYLGIPEKQLKGLEHVQFGMVQLKSGKMSTREGNVVKLEDLLNESISRAKEIIEKKNPNLENKDKIAKKVGIGAVIFNDMSAARIKDEVFDWNTILNFQGETGPYVQYTYVRTKSVIEKTGDLPQIKDIKVENLQDEYSLAILKLIYSFEDTLIQVTTKNEPSILTKYLIDLAKAYSSFYNENKIIGENKEIQDARVYLTYATSEVLKIGANLLGIEMPEKM